MPPVISFSIYPIQNPKVANITTSSFSLKTYNNYGSKLLDSIYSLMTVSFNCSSTCKTCSSSSTTCTSCQGLSSANLFLSNQCLSSCPLGYYNDTLDNCDLCDQNCLTCGGTSTNCTSCTSGLVLTGSYCKNTSLFYTQYYFYFSGCGVVISILVLLCKCCCCDTSWINSVIAFASLPEIASWGCLFYLYFTQTTYFHILTCGAALGLHVILNIVYGLTHQKMIIH